MSFDFDLPHASGNLAGGAGVQPWSSPEQYVIFSIDRPDDDSNRSEAYQTRTGAFDALLGDWGIGFKRVIGHYTFKDGREIDEPAWIINARDWRKVAASGWIDGQESVLHLGPWVDGGRGATLVFGWAQVDSALDRLPSCYGCKTLGTFALTTEARAKREDAWTFDPVTAEYYVAE